MTTRLSQRRSMRTAATVAVVCGLSLTTFAHNIAGTRYPDLAKARLSRTLSSTCQPISAVMPVEGTDLYVACFDVQNLSPDGARITAIGFDLPGDFGEFALVAPNDFGAELESYAGFEIRNDVDRVPDFPETVLDFALVTGQGFTQGRSCDGIGPNLKTTVCVKGPFPPGLQVETLLDYVYVRFEKVGPHGAFTDVGRP
jgi:hypothetical protein